MLHNSQDGPGLWSQSYYKVYLMLLSTSTYSHSTQAPRLGAPETTQTNPYPTEEETGHKACRDDLLRGITGLDMALGSVQGSVIWPQMMLTPVVWLW